MSSIISLSAIWSKYLTSDRRLLYPHPCSDFKDFHQQGFRHGVMRFILYQKYSLVFFNHPSPGQKANSHIGKGICSIKIRWLPSIAANSKRVKTSKWTLPSYIFFRPRGFADRGIYDADRRRSASCRYCEVLSRRHHRQTLPFDRNHHE